MALGLALRELQNIHPCTYVQGVLSFDIEALDRWYGVNKYYHMSQELTV